MDLKNIQWGEFEIGKIFIIENGVCNSFDKLKSKNGLIDCVGATSKNNGNVSFADFKYNNLTVSGNCIIFIKTGEGSVGDAIYKKNRFIPSKNVYVGRCGRLNSLNANFIVTIINNQSNKYNYGYVRNNERILKEKVLLPMTTEGEPDYAFMEQFMRQKEQEKIEKFQNYIAKRIEQVKDFKEVEPLNQKEWGEFFLNEVFAKIQRGKRLKKDDHKNGKMPYISSSAMNNGIDGFVSNKEKVRIFRNCLSIANSGSVGATFYQPFSFVASDHITQLESDNFKEFIYLFISTVTKRLSEKYSFNREINDTRIQREKIVLPTDKKGQPDYSYMENYIKKLEHGKLTNYLSKKQRMHNQKY